MAGEKRKKREEQRHKSLVDTHKVFIVDTRDMQIDNAVPGNLQRTVAVPLSKVPNPQMLGWGPATICPGVVPRLARMQLG